MGYGAVKSQSADISDERIIDLFKIHGPLAELLHQEMVSREIETLPPKQTATSLPTSRGLP